ncbi:Amidohydrolase [Candidatus Zixiibacteriota bacterium]|nr:Amidohydrolase [candidate division Zixibacteria bacterium]
MVKTAIPGNLDRLKEIVLKAAEKLYPTQVEWRRWLHQHPELSNREFDTTKFILEQLKKRGVKTVPLKMKTGALALMNEKKGIALAIRTDIDALPIDEKNKVAFKSRNDGIMHACGHDIHMAVVLGTTVLLSILKENLPGAVKVIYQPAEEMPPGGAEMMIREGILRNPDVKMVLSLHNDPSLAVGKIGLRDGPIMASVTDFDITVIGRGGHAARPHLGVDAIVTATEIVESLQKIVSRETDPFQPVVITFGMISGGRARNVICDRVQICGTARTLSAASRKVIPNLIRRTVDGVCRARGAEYKIDFIAQYPVLSNWPEANKIFAECYTTLFGPGKVVTSPQSMGGEDFANYIQKIPGAMLRLGVRNRKIGATEPWHSDKFMADERSIFYGTSLLTLAAIKGLGEIAK